MKIRVITATIIIITLFSPANPHSQSINNECNTLCNKLLELNFQVFSKTSDISRRLIKYLRKEYLNFDIVDPGMKFNTTDLIVPKLPSRRLILGGECESYGFILFEQGGIGLHNVCIIYRIKKKRVEEHCWIVLEHEIMTLEKVKDKILKKEYTIFQ